MERVVYLLGAGFSAPLGIPVIKDFLMTAKDLYFEDQIKYGHFDAVLQNIKDMYCAKTYYNIDLLNIEEILSILDMEDQVTGKNRSKEFADFIAAVVQAKTPQMPEPDFRKDNYDDFLYNETGFHHRIFGSMENPLNAYCQFVANLLNLRLEVQGISSDYKRCMEIFWSRIQQPKVSYSVVTLNYDLVIENCIDHIKRYCKPCGPETELFAIAKLHGSVDGEIVAPTWKMFAKEGLQEHWKLAHKLLREANYLRILGYSMPPSDSYMRYLLAESAIESPHLKKIEVICLDDGNKTVENRYRDFIGFKYYDFKNGNIGDYLRFDKSTNPE